MADINIFTGQEDKPSRIEAVKPTDDVILSEKLLEQFYSARNAWAASARENDDFRHGHQWTKEQEKELKHKRQSPIVVNVIQPAVEQAISLLTANKPRFQASAREGSDRKVASIITDLLSYIWDHSDGNIELKKVIDDYYVKGLGALQAYYDPYKDFGKGEICIKSVDPMDIYIDPNSKDIFCRDAAHVLIARLFTRDQLSSQYPTLIKEIQSAKPSGRLRDAYSSRTALEQLSGTVPGESQIYEVIDRYTKIRKPYHHLINKLEEKILEEEDFNMYIQTPAFILQKESGIEYASTEQEVAEAIQLFNETGGKYHLMFNPQTQQPEVMPGDEFHEGTIPGSQTTMIPVTIGKLIEAGVIQHDIALETRILRVMSAGGVELYKGVLEIDDYPIVFFMNRHNRNPYPMGDVSFVKPLQEYVNKLRSLIIAHASNSTNTKLLIPRGAAKVKDIEEKWAQTGTAVIEFEAEIGVPQVAAPAPLPNELYKNEADARADIQEILGIYPLGQGDASQAPTTYKGTVAVDEYGQRRIKSKRDDIEAGLTQLARVVTRMMQVYYTQYKIIRLIQPNSAPTETEINIPMYDEYSGLVIKKINDITVGRYDVIVVSGSMLPNNRWARFEYYVQLYQLGLIDQIELLKQTEVVDIEGVLARQNQIKQLQDMAAAQQEEIKRLKGDLQTAQRESVSDRKRVEVEKFKANLAKSANKADMATQLYQARLADNLRSEQPNPLFEEDFGSIAVEEVN